jgi:rhodanese-related sulfurtransferase
MTALSSRLLGAALAAAGLIASCNSHEGAKPAANAPVKSEPAVQASKPAPPPAPPPAPTPTPAAPTPTKPVAANPPAAPAAPPPAAKDTPASQPAPGSNAELAKKWFISTERAKELFDKKEVDGKQVIFVDARTYVEFTEGHIRGSMCYSTKYTQGAPQAKLKNYLPGSAVVLYCHGETCTDSLDVGRYFESLHVEIGPIFVIKDGFPGWEKAYPNLVDKGPEVGFN